MRTYCEFCGEPLTMDGYNHYFGRKDICFNREIKKLKETIFQLKQVIDDQEFDNRFEKYAHRNLYIRNNNPY